MTPIASERLILYDDVSGVLILPAGEKFNRSAPSSHVPPFAHAGDKRCPQ